MAGMPVGPLTLQDEVAIDLGYKVLQQTKADLGEAAVAGPNATVIEAMYNQGRYGRKNGKGFFVYGEEGKSLWDELDQFAPNGKVLDEQPSVEEIKDRILYAQAIEAARTMEENIVEDPREADVGSILAWGFAPYTGGVLSFIDTIGAKLRRPRR
jgi:3-hydroxyacyl-CoA dehydrogenase/enoyl-CoA hydratase/3-hydroxybutyryl-CoA epimerase